MSRRRRREIRNSGAAAPQPRHDNASAVASEEAAFERGHSVPLTGSLAGLFAIAAALSAGGAIWIALQPAATHSALDGALFGSLLRWIFYLPPTLVGVWLAGSLLDRVGPPGPGPVITALALAIPAVVAGTLGETLARLGLAYGEILALDGVLQRLLELVRVDVPIGAIAAVLLARAAHAASAPAHPVGR
jgi:hypothetical protein